MRQSHGSEAWIFREKEKVMERRQITMKHLLCAGPLLHALYKNTCLIALSQNPMKLILSPF